MGFFDKLFRRVKLEMEELDSATVVRFPGDLLDEKEIHLVRSQLLSVAERCGQKDLILDFCDILFVGDNNGVIHTTYNLLLDGDRLVLSIWGSGTTYYREGTTPPPSID